MAIKQVWAQNLKDEIRNLSQLIQRYNVIAIDTEFGGMPFKKSMVINYPEHLRCVAQMSNNVNRMKLIQLGIAISDSDGNKPEGTDAWQFNFEYDVNDPNEMKSMTSIQFLMDNGVQFSRHLNHGINHEAFRKLFDCPRFLMNPRITWITYHGTFDMGYIIRLVAKSPIIISNESFYCSLKSIFPRFIDLRRITTCPQFRERFPQGGGLQALGGHLHCTRTGNQHNAGSDAKFTLDVYHQVANKLDKTELRSMNGVLADLPLSDFLL